MRVGRLIMASFCLASTISGPQALAVGSDGLNANKKNKVVALVRLENNEAKCVNYVRESDANNSRLQIPLCSNDGLSGEQNLAAMDVAISGGQRTAWLTHAGAFVSGCVVGATSAIIGMPYLNQQTEDRIPEEYKMFVGLAGLTTLVSIPSTILIDTTGHALAGWSGLLLCGGGITYLIYSQQSEKNHK